MDWDPPQKIHRYIEMADGQQKSIKRIVKQA